MKKLPTVLACVAIFATLWGAEMAVRLVAQWGGEDPATATGGAAQLDANTWMLRTPTGAGSAVHIQTTNDLPRLLTAAHNVRDFTKADSLFLVRGSTTNRVRIVWVSRDHDVALIESASKVGFGPGATIARKPAVVGEKITHFGFFLGPKLGPSYSEGVVSALDRKPDLPEWPWTSPLDQAALVGLNGCSGGGVFNERGQLVGIFVGAVNEVIKFYVPVRRIVPLLAAPPG